MSEGRKRNYRVQVTTSITYELDLEAYSDEEAESYGKYYWEEGDVVEEQFEDSSIYIWGDYCDEEEE